MAQRKCRGGLSVEARQLTLRVSGANAGAKDFPCIHKLALPHEDGGFSIE